MLLKSIEVRGFKSFADKTDLAFIKGITAVVGPNGSGKSNISDAVRWVLGEQSVKSLRGGKMEDVIFAGTQFRKPVGLAQVSLTLDNTDGQLPIEYSDVTISRRLYRSGESEYYINNTHCRLKDIQELFMDTGIGKEGYSIIGQGKIDAILSGKPEERRSLLEEAAGIVKFKSRKEEAEKRLENTEQNLIRINDILKTYEERLDPLRVESEKAKAFLELSNNLKEKEVNLIMYSIDNIKSKVDHIKTAIENIHNETSEINAQKDKLKEKLQILNDELEKHDLQTKNNQEEYYKNKSDLQEINSETNLLEERTKNLYSIIERNSEEINKINEKIKDFHESKVFQENNLKQYQDQLLAINNDITVFENEIIGFNSTINESEELISKLKDDDIELLRQISETKNVINNLESEKQQLERKIEDFKASTENFINSLKINTTTKAMLELNIEEIKNKINQDDEEIKRNRNEITRLNGYLAKDEKELKDRNVNQNRFEANCQMLINLEKQYEGYNKAVRTLMQDINNGKISNARSNSFVLGEVIDVTKDLEIAIEIAIGGAISDIITSNDVIAKQLIQYLKTNNLGRATFLPLNIIKGRKLSNIEHIKKIPGYVGIASDLIKYDSKFESAIEHVLGRTIVSTNMDSALEIARKTNYNYKIVTLTGETVNSGGSMTGGSIFHKSASIIGRKREIEELVQKLEEEKIKIADLTKKIDITKNSIKSLDEACLNAKDEIYLQNIEITKLQGKISSIVNESERITKNLSTSKDEIHFIKEKISNILVELSLKKSLLEEIIQKEEINSLKINELQASVKEYGAKLIELREKHVSLKIRKAQNDEIVVNKIRELQRLSNEIDELTEKRNSLQGESSDSQNNIRISRETIKNNKNKLENITICLQQLEKSFKENEIIRIKIRENIKITTEELEELSLTFNKKEDEIHRQEVSLAKFETERETLLQKLNEELNLTYAEAQKYRTSIENIDLYRKEISELKAKITSLGVVNVGSIEEHIDVRDKYTFMSSQKEDLTKAKAELLAMINEMTQKMKTVFSDNLNKLRVVFNETFRELFKGGSADLILSEGDELTANIEINVEPPGKKLQNINLMSGGEKVLSAIALLFAILKMKPTPFCILDEIEAALDDANVLRYAEFLRKFSGNIQFIVITHRKGTMEVSDVLYGVTMEEKGVSKVVSVDLNKQPV